MQVKLKNIEFKFLLAGLFFYLVIAPFLLEFAFFYVVINLLLLFVLLSALFTLHTSRALRLFFYITLSVILIPLALDLFGILHLPPITNYAILSLYLLILACSLLYRSFSAKKVTANVIYAALCFYLLVGIFWGAVYALIDSVAPGSFQGTILNLSNIPEMKLHGFIYYSFTTLTTLGYGDIVPQSLQAASLCQTEAIIGQFFTSVLIARLVGIHIAQRLRGEI